MTSQRTARSIGLLYLVTMLPAPLNLVYLPSRFIVKGDPAATAQRITEGESVYRLCTLAGLWSTIMFLFLAVALYRLFEKVDRNQARLLLVLVIGSVAISLAVLVVEVAPLILLSGADYFSSLAKPQLDALSFAFLRIRGTGLGIASAFWGLWLFPFGVLVFNSGFMPRWIGILLMVGCFGYLAQSLTTLMWPEYAHTVFTATIPIVGPGEITASLWLLARGNRIPLPRPAMA